MRGGISCKVYNIKHNFNLVLGIGLIPCYPLCLGKGGHG